MRFIALFMLAISAFSAPAAFAQEPPGRVGRLAFTEGTVAIYQDPEQGWEKAYVNSPVTSENSVWTDPKARAELRVAGMALRLGEATQLDISRLDDDELSAFVPQGTLALRVRHFDNDQRLDLGTPHGHFRIFGTGRFRIDVDPDRDETLLTVYAGTASLRAAGGDVKVDAGGALRVFGGEAPSFSREAARSDAFDRWTLARDERWSERRSTRYVSPEMTGYEDLDTYGEWIEEPEYGYVWYPTRVARDWVPYRDGRWMWVRPWGWTWVADEPWGYAPFHYGRWVYVRDRWCWYPGARTTRPVWAPALVAWVGGSGFNVRLSSGVSPALGWYPLAPWERYDPWYRTNPTYVNRINVVVRDGPPRQWRGRDRDEWRHWNRDRAATIVRRDQFVEGRPINQAAIRDVKPEVLRQAQVAPAATVLPGPQEFRRASRAPVQTQAAPSVQQQQAPGSRELVRRQQGPAERPQFGRAAQVPAQAPAPQERAAIIPAPAQPPAAPASGPFGRQDARTEEQRAAREQQQRERAAAREAQRQRQQQPQAPQQQAPAARELQQQPAEASGPFGRQDARTQERAQREAVRQQQLQQQQQQQQQQQMQQQQQQQQQQQERAAREAQRQQAQQQQQLHQQQLQQQQAQERAQREAQQQQERAQREAQGRSGLQRERQEQRQQEKPDRQEREDRKEDRKDDRKENRDEERPGRGRK